jgi:hypothetical protein
MNEFKKCSNGHYYQGASCPFCPQTGAADGSGATQTMGGDSKTQIYGGGNAPTQDEDKTRVMGGFNANNAPTISDGSVNGSYSCSRTIFGDEVETSAGGVNKVERQYRNVRKLVGWLVTYSVDKMGVDFKVYEGRNIIGRDMDCNITVNDGMVSGKHATLLFRANRYSLTDSQSTHGTFVNDEDIALDPHYLNDGDVIRMGETVFKFRSSL